MQPITNSLIKRLNDKGIETSNIPALMRDTINAISPGCQGQKPGELTGKLQYLGWYDFEMDEHTFQLIVAIIETHSLADLNGNLTQYNKAVE